MYSGQIYLGQATLPLHGWDEQIRRRATAHCDVEQLELGAGDWMASGFLSNINLKANSLMNLKLKAHLQWISAQLPRTNTQLLCAQLNLLRRKGRGEKSHLSRYISFAITCSPVMQFVLCCRYLKKKKTSGFQPQIVCTTCAHVLVSDICEYSHCFMTISPDCSAEGHRSKAAWHLDVVSGGSLI